ncbi:MAG: D-alanyl-D-alanine carboxypeptidase family protein [Spirochaetaceae bacterium]|nr:MAG: D-alanyl-D-alanine carboxypeptidase family protein [Spirochaetaceae bacterium]
MIPGKQKIPRRTRNPRTIIAITFLFAATAATAVAFGIAGVSSPEKTPGFAPSITGQSGNMVAGIPVKFPFEDSEWFADPAGILLVVDRETALAGDYVPPDLVVLSYHGIKTKSNDQLGRRIVTQDLRMMFDDAKIEGHTFYIFSAYRSFETQRQTYNYWVEKLGRAEADRSSARPGHSEHQLGTTFDISATDFKGDVFVDFGKSDAGIWLAAHAFEYGFVMSYPLESEPITGYIHEPWHFRYVGHELAMIIHEKGMVPSVLIRELEQFRQENKRENGTTPIPGAAEPGHEQQLQANSSLSKAIQSTVPKPITLELLTVNKEDP